MDYRCARCHTKFAAAAEGEEALRCPECHAEAGLEPVQGIPTAMKLFGLFLGGAVVATAVAMFLARASVH
ncbi:MAG: hypothetical protein R3A51_07610 [Nannocystaceae bacterium]|nr:hypothetical protein [Myxococcales bacterium]